MKRSTLLLAAIVSLSAGTAAAQSASISNVPESATESVSQSLNISDEALDASSQFSVGNFDQSGKALEALGNALVALGDLSKAELSYIKDDIVEIAKFISSPERVFDASTDSTEATGDMARSLGQYLLDLSADPSAKVEQSLEATGSSSEAVLEGVSDLAISTGQAVSDTKTAAKAKAAAKAVGDAASSSADATSDVASATYDEVLKPLGQATANGVSWTGDQSVAAAKFAYKELLKPTGQATGDVASWSGNQIVRAYKATKKLVARSLELSTAGVEQVSATIETSPAATSAGVESTENSATGVSDASEAGVSATSNAQNWSQVSEAGSNSVSASGTASSDSTVASYDEISAVKRQKLQAIRGQNELVARNQLIGAETPQEVQAILSSPIVVAAIDNMVQTDRELGIRSSVEAIEVDLTLGTIGL